MGMLLNYIIIYDIIKLLHSYNMEHRQNVFFINLSKSMLIFHQFYMTAVSPIFHYGPTDESIVLCLL